MRRRPAQKPEISFSPASIRLHYNVAPMKYLILFCCVFALLLRPVAAQDPVKVSPEYYKVLLDNDEMRLLEVRIKPGEKEPVHSHPPGVVYALSDAKVKSTSADGKSEEVKMKNGEARWRDATTHSVENTGDTEVRALVIELKKAKK